MSDFPHIGTYNSTKPVYGSNLLTYLFFIAVLNYPIDFFSYNFIRLGRTCAKALQTVRRFPRETSRRSDTPKSNASALAQSLLPVDSYSYYSVLTQT